MFEFNLDKAKWFYEPKKYNLRKDYLEIFTEANTDLCQKTYYGFQNDNAHILYVTTNEKYFSFTVKAEFEYLELFDQCGVGIYQNSDNWVKAGIELHDKNTSWLGSVVTNNGYSDWATTDIDSNLRTIWYRISRREDDFCLENSIDGKVFKQMRIFHFFQGKEDINIGLLACSPSKSSFKAVFSDMKVTECLWKKHE